MEKERFSSKVIVRLRPLSSGEEATKAAPAAGLRCAQPTPCGTGLVLSVVGNAVFSTTTATTTTPPTAAAASSSSSNDNTTSSSFSFPDGVLGEGASQREAYEAVSEVVEGVLLGKSASIIAYGQTGAGKTHTLFGGDGKGERRGKDPGVAPRALSSLYRALVASGGKAAGTSMKLSAVEIYCDKVRCLLTKGEGSNKAAVTIGASAADGGVSLQGAAAAEVDLSSASAASASVSALLAAVSQARVVASTGMNDASSRSHAVIIATVRVPVSPSSSACSPSAAKTETRTIALNARLALVDLAGSERASRAHTASSSSSSSVAAEGRAINASLTALGKVVAALAEEAEGSSSPSHSSVSAAAAPQNNNRGSHSQGHVPYRDSSLTRVLRDCLDGSSRAAFLICASPAQADARETLGSLRFGSRARGLVAAVQVGEVSSSIPAPRTPAEEEETRKEMQARRRKKSIGGVTPLGRRGGGGKGGEEEGGGGSEQLLTSSTSSSPRLLSSLSRTQRGAVAALLSVSQLVAVFVLVQGK